MSGFVRFGVGHENAWVHVGASRLAVARRSILAVCLAIATRGSADILPGVVQPTSWPSGTAESASHPWLDQYRAAAALRSHRHPSVAVGAIPVSTCANDGVGSLRDAVASAVSGDTIDMTQLTCSTITLTSGAIGIGIDDLTLVGPGAASLSIYGTGQDGVLFHAGLGTLTIEGLGIEHGYKYSANQLARGGCIFSDGSVALDNAQVFDCEAHASSSSQEAKGGAIYAANAVFVDNLSGVSHSIAYAPFGGGRGGGIYAKGDLEISEDSFIAFSEADEGGGAMTTGDFTMTYGVVAYNISTKGGGLRTHGALVIANSSLFANHGYFAGALYADAVSAASPIIIISSTISGNVADISGGGLMFGYHDAAIYNSTIAYNSEGYSHLRGAGISLYNSNLTLHSTIVANNENTSAGAPVEDDIGYITIGSISGAANLVRSSTLGLPLGTITADPLFGGRVSEGLTPTIALRSGSPAIDRGSNLLNLQDDQRGPGFPRVSGDGPDIGAYEFTDGIFRDGFD